MPNKVLGYAEIVGSLYNHGNDRTVRLRVRLRRTGRDARIGMRALPCGNGQHGNTRGGVVARLPQWIADPECVPRATLARRHVSAGQHLLRFPGLSDRRGHRTTCPHLNECDCRFLAFERLQ